MSLRGLVASKLKCPKCGQHPTLEGYAGCSYWWCLKCNKEVKE